MKTLSIVIQWLIVTAILAFVGYILVRPVPQPDYTPELWEDWNGVTVLSYAGIARSDTPDYPSVKLLEAQLAALRDAGYRTVRPEDVRAFLEERAPLPEKALLLIFEGGRKEAFIRATPILQRVGFSAVIVVPTAVMHQWGGFYLKRKDIRKVVKLPQWQIGSMGDRAVEAAPGYATAEDGHFLAKRGRAGGQEESANAFRDRLLQDYARSAQTLEAAAGRTPVLYLYPFAEAGQSPGSDPLAEAANRDGVTRHYGLAFIGGFNAFNGPGSDPWALTRLRVPGNWPPERLLAELASSQPRGRPQTGLGTAQEWVFEREAELRDDALRVGTGAAVWLRGTESWTDVELSADLQPETTGSGALYARYTSLRSWLRVAADAQGIRVQERLGSRLFTLFRLAAPADAQTARHIRLRLRNNRAWLWLDGKPVAENLPLSPGTQRGRIGFGSDEGELIVRSFSASTLPSRWFLANSIRLVPDAERGPVQAILPNWFRAGEQPILAQTAQQDLLQTAVAGIRTVPLLTGGAGLSNAQARAWAAAIDDELIRANLKPLVPSLAIDCPSLTLATELRNRNYSVTHLLSPADAQEWGRSIAQATSDEVIVVNGSGAEADRAVHWLKLAVSTRRLAQLEADDAAAPPGLPSVRLYDPNTDRRKERQP